MDHLELYVVGRRFPHPLPDGGPGSILSLQRPYSLLLLTIGPIQPEINGVDSGEVRFAWVQRPASGYLLFKYGVNGWTDAPFSPQLASTPLELEPVQDGTHLLVHTFMVDVSTKILVAMRPVSWPGYFINTVRASLRNLTAKQISPRDLVADQNEFYRRYPDPTALDRLVRTLPREARCTGGQREDRPAS